jgi:hypothetical protein
MGSHSPTPGLARPDKDYLSDLDATANHVTERRGCVQVKIWLSQTDADALRHLAETREQTMSGAIRYLLRPFRERMLVPTGTKDVDTATPGPHTSPRLKTP